MSKPTGTPRARKAPGRKAVTARGTAHKAGPSQPLEDHQPKARQRRPEEVKARILKAALHAFALHGYEGTSTRLVSDDANVSVSLLLHHFQSKENLWKATIDYAFSKMSISTITEASILANASNAERLKSVIRMLVTGFAELPDLHRLMTLEAHKPSERLTWLCETYIKDGFKKMCDLIAVGQKEGTVRPISPARLRYAIVAVASIPFSVSAEYQYLTGRNPFSQAEVESSVEFINRLVFVEN